MSRNTNRVSSSDRQESIDLLRGWVGKGATIYCVLRHRSASGMSRTIQFFTIETDPMPGEAPRLLFLGYHIARATGYGWDNERNGVRVKGCGMDMGFAVVYDLARVLFDDPNALRHDWI